MIIKKTTLPPHVQKAYLQSMLRQASGGYVNPQLRVDIAPAIKAESNRMQTLEEAGYRESRAKQELADTKRLSERELSISRGRLGLQSQRLGMMSDDISSWKKGNVWSNILGLGTMGLAYHDAKKTKAEALLAQQDERNLLGMQLGYLKEFEPSAYSWYTSQPYIKERLKRFGISF